MAMELIKENIEYEKLLEEKSLNNVVKGEYVIPDVQPDVNEILMVDAKPFITNKQVMQNKVFLEGKILCNVLYNANVDDVNEVCDVSYTKDFAQHIEIYGVEPSMSCLVDCNIEHIECGIVNERKISIEAIVQLKSSVYNKVEFEVVKDIDDMDDVQLLRAPAVLDKVIGVAEGEMLGKATIKVPTEKPQIEKILKCNVLLNKKDTKLSDGNAQLEAFANIAILYKALGSQELCCMEENVFMNTGMEIDGADYFMNSFSNFEVQDVEWDVKEDDLGEKRIVDVEALVKCRTKVVNKEEVNVIEDAYSTSKVLEMDKKNYDLDLMLGQNRGEVVIKENIEMEDVNIRPMEIYMTTGNVCITDKKILEDKVIIEGILTARVLYKTDSAEKSVCALEEEIPFTCPVEVTGAKIDMAANAKVNIETLDAFIEANTIAVKGIVVSQVRVNYKDTKEFLVGITHLEDEVLKKKASVTIYVVQKGDTLWKIAKRYCTTVEDLVKANNIENEDKIMPGMKLIIPGRTII